MMMVITFVTHHRIVFDSIRWRWQVASYGQLAPIGLIFVLLKRVTLNALKRIFLAPQLLRAQIVT